MGALVERVGLFPTRRPKLALALVAGVTLVLGAFLPRLKIDSSMETIFLQDHERRVYEEFKQTFGEDEIVVVGLQPASGDVFTAATLGKIARITQAIEDLPPELGVDRVVSLTNVDDVRAAGEDAFEVVRLIPDPIPTDPEALATIRRQAFENPIFVRNLVSADGRTAAINVTLLLRPEDPTFKERLVVRVQELVAAERGADAIHLAGIPVLTQYTSDYLRRDMAVFIPVTILVIALALWAVFRTLPGVILPLATVGLSVAWTLGFVGLLGRSISILSSIVPSLLIAMGSAFSIHVLTEVAHTGDDEPEGRLPAAMRRLAAAVCLAGLTTVLGFASLTTNDVAQVREFGLYAAFGIASATVIALIAIPALLQLVGGAAPVARARAEGRGARILGAVAGGAGELALRRPRTVVAAALTLAGLGVWGASLIQVDTDYASNFKPDSEPVRALRFMRDNLSGERPINVVLTPRSGEPDAVLRPENLARIDAVGRMLLEHPLVSAQLSLAEYLKRMNQAFRGGDPRDYALPGTASLAAQYLLLYTRPEDLDRLKAFDGTSAAVVGRSSIISSDEFLRFMQQVEARARAELGDEVDVHVTGSMHLLSRASIAVSVGQAKSLGVATALIFALMFVLFRSLRLGLVALLPNVLPILANFALMGALGVTLNTGTSVMAAMALGIAVDDTIHFLVRYRALRATLTAPEAVRATLQTAGVAIAATSGTNLLGFLVLTLSSFAPLVALGWLTATTMATALVADLLFLPALLVLVDRLPPSGARPAGAASSGRYT